MSGPRHVAVIGAGIVGVATALFLQRDAHRVTLIDRAGPAAGASYGNAGGVVLSACMPIGMPGIVCRVPAMLLDRDGPLRVRWRYLPRIAPWLLAFVRASHPARVEEISCTLAAILRAAEAPWHDLVRGRAVAALLRPVGWLRVYDTDAGFAAVRPVLDLMTRRGFTFEVLSQAALRELEPALAPIFRRGVWHPESYSVADPGRMVRDLAAAFVADGGTLMRAEVRDIETANGASRVMTDGGPIAADAVVVAAGAWSRALARRLGVRVPLDTERGYHLMLAPAEPGLRRPTVWGERGFVLAPHAEGIRLTSGVEFAGLDAPPDFRPIRRLVPLARRMLPSLRAEERSAWLGFRPSLPDSLPVIGPVPGRRDIFFAFGHGHLGLTLGPATGRAVADVIAGRRPAFDLEPFAVARWSCRR
ncbi:MAG: FAD-binding oxidoreductase [Alphaproteobacteria bacterium]|nr:MAG: FAD-binding oxidoreductase [Alphaproteobacteria bacterium]